MAPGLVIQVSIATMENLLRKMDSVPIHPPQGMSFLCRKTKGKWELLMSLTTLTFPSSAIFILLQAVRVTKPNIPEAIRRNYELM